MPQNSKATISVVGIDIGENWIYIVAHDERGANVRLATTPG